MILWSLSNGLILLHLFSSWIDDPACKSILLESYFYFCRYFFARLIMSDTLLMITFVGKFTTLQVPFSINKSDFSPLAWYWSGHAFYTVSFFNDAILYGGGTVWPA